jgi:hypothetical protein
LALAGLGGIVGLAEARSLDEARLALRLRLLNLDESIWCG